MEEKNNNKGCLLQNFSEFCSKHIILIVSLIVGIIAICSFFITAYFEGTFENMGEKTSYKLDNILINLVLFILANIIILVIYKICKKIKNNNIIKIVLIISFIFQFLWVVQLRFVPESDQKSIINCAEAFREGSYQLTMNDDSYLSIYPFQVGIVLYIEMIYNIFNESNVIILQLLNVVYSTIILFIMYKIVDILFEDNENKEKIQKIAIILLFGFSWYFLFFNVHVYGNIIGLMFALMATYQTIKYLKYKKVRNIIATMPLIAIAIILKSNYNIFLCGIAITLILDFLKDRKKATLIGTIALIIFYILSQKVLTFYVEKRTGYEQNRGVPMISYIYMGMANPRNLSSGWYTADTVEIYRESNYQKEEASEKSIELIGKRIKEFVESPGIMIDFYKDKIASTWLNPTFQTIWCSEPTVRLESYPEYKEYLIHKKVILSMLSGKIYKIEEQYFNIYQLIIFGFGAYGLWIIRKRKETYYCLFPIIFFGGFLFHILWETKAIYVLQYYILLLPYAAYGWYNLYRNLKEFINKKYKVKKLKEGVK